ncbi:hypothetical protein P8C59_009442 [Phyllachora maydis]|uniref:Uncharacterized protein n=1 Tax=Phyllachora maydis TaxID=1825666 RepID=A0AAD9IF43_9PEZI|nr:hypothetical protein P8C59_009442 [Phyllachora maydis]
MDDAPSGREQPTRRPPPPASAPASDATSHSALDPVPASLLAARETARRDGCMRKGTIRTGCAEVDETVLLGGFERGCVVGVSAEDDRFALQLGLQSIAHALVAAPAAAAPAARIITTQATAALAPALRACVVAQLLVQQQQQQQQQQDVDARAKALLRRVSLSRVFDVQGLWEALRELEHEAGPAPDVILITHMAGLMKALFAAHKASAHATLQRLASHLRQAARAPPRGGPLVMVLNATGAASPGPASTTAAAKPLDPTLRSIFDAPPARRSRPAFGLVFTQMLDMHLLCTRVPRDRADAQAVAGASSGGGVASGARFVWVVECLLDEIGVWEEEEEEQGREERARKGRRCREQRWGAVDFDGEYRLVDAFRS